MKNNDIDKIIDDVYRGLNDFIKNGSYKELLISMGNLNKYSLLNQIYIYMQNPKAYKVLGVRAWNFLGRSVKKGEKGIKIIAPNKKKIKSEEKDEYGDLIYKEEYVISGYKKINVFDISQTKGKQLKEYKIKDSNVENKNSIIKALSGVVGKENYSISYKTELQLGEGCKGLCNHKTKEIYLLVGMNDAEEISTLIHECAHALAHNPYKSDFDGIRHLKQRDIKEVEAESIACIVTSYLGLDVKEFNFSYISSWAMGDISKFKNNLDNIKKYSTLLIDALDSKV